MYGAGQAEKLLEQIALLLETQRELVLAGDADALPEAGNKLSFLLGQAAAQTGTALAPALRQRLVDIQKQALAIGAMLNRRQSDVQRGLDALGRANGQINDVQSCKVYAPAGLMVSSLNTRAVASA
ncbi:MAG: hypothetical protein V4562_01975 [Pseudomonadota bacterium]